MLQRQYKELDVDYVQKFYVKFLGLDELIEPHIAPMKRKIDSVIGPENVGWFTPSCLLRVSPSDPIDWETFQTQGYIVMK